MLVTEKLRIRARDALKVAHQESIAYMQDGVRINDAFWYHVSKEYPGQIGIHLYKMKTGNTLTEMKAALKLYKDGLKELARRLENDPELVHINEIAGWSKIVYQKPELLELLGFEVTERDEKKKEALAIMGRKDFLERYPPTPQTEPLGKMA